MLQTPYTATEYLIPVAVPELESARLEFMEELDGAVSSVITEITGQVVFLQLKKFSREVQNYVIY